MNVYKLRYKNKETAIADLIIKGVYIETEEVLTYVKGVHAVVECGLIVLENGTYDEQGNQINPPIYEDGFHYDIMCEQTIDFGTADITNQIKNPKHAFAGYEVFN